MGDHNPVYENSELVLGLVAPVGTNFDKLLNILRRCLDKFDYELNAVKLSSLAQNFKVKERGDHAKLQGSEEYIRLVKRMHGGSYLRRSVERGDVLALAAAKGIARIRSGGAPLERTAHVIRSLKHPDEVRTLEEILDELLGRLCPKGEDPKTWKPEARRLLNGTRILDITEYGRSVHAEMEALLCCARSGSSPVNGSLFCTTFPCHNCAKHIVAAGIIRVVYVEPYPKSRALQLYHDSIERPENRSAREGGATGVSSPAQRKVLFEPFSGVGPRRFFDLFSMNLSSGTRIRRKKGWQKVGWEPRTAVVRVPLLPNSYLDRERLADDEMVELTKDEHLSNVE